MTETVKSLNYTKNVLQTSLDAFLQCKRRNACSYCTRKNGYNRAFSNYGLIHTLKVIGPKR